MRVKSTPYPSFVFKPQELYFKACEGKRYEMQRIDGQRHPWTPTIPEELPASELPASWEEIGYPTKEERAYEGGEGEWAAGTFTHCTNGNSGNGYFTNAAVATSLLLCRNKGARPDD
ncbi:hypothetical protein EVAR_92262_1 [Eumeta japonica]|uniref:Uncharacterized protein n=1 Tax=Eumeta variegata TaxID=151549 RepID=A0A4C1TNJ8_EUMVA|nr:hypothetical protein EVAR_92262_1 [Eumeta japonica]